jgi:AcrR family transcriptional regulator
MGTVERREREREAIRMRIVEAARDLVGEKGLDALSMRALGERIEYAPATIYLYFRDKDEVIRTVVEEGFKRLSECIGAAVAELGPEADAAEQYRATGRGYALFALDHTGYFRTIFRLPTAPQITCPEPREEAEDFAVEWRFERVVGLLERAAAEGLLRIPDVGQAALVGWGLVHGLTTLFITGHLGQHVQSREQFLALMEQALATLYVGWHPEGAARETFPVPAA